MKSKIEIPGIAIVIIIIVSVVLGAKGIKYILNYSTGTQQLKTSQKKTSAGTAKPETFSSFDEMRPDRSFSDYRIAIENDLLRPLGWQKPIGTPAPSEPVVQREMQRERPAPTNDLVLTGIVNLAGESIALIEDVSKGEAYFLREGDELKDYIVEAIGEENITLANQSSKLVTVLGSKAHYGSGGRIFTSELTDRQTTEGLVEGGGGEPASSDEGAANLSLVERMKARRRKELEQE